MATLSEHKPGDFCWMELGATQQPAAKAFYGNLFGWNAQDNPLGPNEIYTMFDLDGRPIAGCYRVRPGTQVPGIPPHWDLYIAVESAEETVRRAADAGGKVIKSPFDVFVYGRMAVIQDPTGATAGNEEGAFWWADLSTPEPAKAAEFYETVFGWSIQAGQGKEAGYLHIRNAEEFIGGIQSQSDRDPNAPPHWLIYFQTTDCVRLTQQAEDLGAHAFLPPVAMPNVGTVSVLMDPQAAVFALYEPLHAA